MRSSWTFHKQTRLPLRKPILKVGNSQYETPLNLAASYNSWVNREMIGLCERYIVQLGEAIADGVEVLGHTAWGCIDLVSFTTAELSKRCGFIYVDRKDDGTGTLERYKKKSLDWYTQVIATNGASLRRGLL